MKICPKCQTIYPDTQDCCPDCDVELILEEPTPKKSKQNWPLIIGILVAVIAAVAIGLVIWLSGSEEAPAETAAPAEGSHHINAYGYDSHSICYIISSKGEVRYTYMNENGETVDLSADEMAKLMDAEVARSGDHVLTNRTLIYYFEQQYYNFYNAYADYISFYIDSSKGLDEQLSTGTATWQQYFLESAINFFLQTAGMYDQAMAAGYELSAEEQVSISDLETDLTYFAQYYGYQTAEEYLQAFYGPYSTVDSYEEFVQMTTIANSYAQAQINQLTFTDEEAEAYYDANAATIQASYGIQKTDQPNVNIRHILIQPTSTTNAAGQSEITDEAWAAAELTANNLYNMWLADPSEENFSTLATTYTQDPGSQSTGGLYEDVYPGQMVTEFNDWCFAEGRQPGDHGIVKTTYGYHLMYFVSQSEEIYWITAAKQLMANEKSTELWINAMNPNAVTNMSKAILLTSTVPTAPSATETATK